MTTTPVTTTTGRFRAGLALSALLGLVSIAFVLVPSPDSGSGRDAPPMLIIVASALFGLVNIGCALIAWRSGNRVAVRINAAALIINALLTMPAFFVDIDAWIKVVAALSVVATVLALVLTLRRERPPYTVTD